jgi:hypothetical protein
LKLGFTGRAKPVLFNDPATEGSLAPSLGYRPTLPANHEDQSTELFSAATSVQACTSALFATYSLWAVDKVSNKEVEQLGDV